MTLRVNEIFYSLNGEGSHVGIPATFVRLTSCRLRCLWCDTPYAFDEGSDMPLSQVLAAVKGHADKTRLVTLTGGNPLEQEETFDLLQALIDHGFSVDVEDAGSEDFARRVVADYPQVRLVMDFKLPGSGMMGHMNLANVTALRERDDLKFVVRDRRDFDTALQVIEQTDPRATILFSPVYKVLDAAQLAAWVLEAARSRWRMRLQVQLHKALWGNRRGV